MYHFKEVLSSLLLYHDAIKGFSSICKAGIYNFMSIVDQCGYGIGYLLKYWLVKKNVETYTVE